LAGSTCAHYNVSTDLLIAANRDHLPRWRRETCGAWDRWCQRKGTGSTNRIAVVCGAGINGVGVSAACEVLRLPVGAISGDWGGGATPVGPLPRCCSPGLHEVLIVAIAAD
jgi:hypothetical protein